MGKQTCSFEPTSLEGTAMRSRGTPDEVTPGQLATIASRFMLALPKALELSGLEAKRVLEQTLSGQELSSALSSLLRSLAEPLELPVHRETRGRPTVNCPLVFFDERNCRLRSIDPALIQFKGIKSSEVSLTGLQMRQRLLNEGFLLLDCAVMDALRTYPKRIPEEMKVRHGVASRRIFFDGASVKDSGGNERSFFIQFRPSGNAWEEDDFPLENMREGRDYVAAMKLEN